MARKIVYGLYNSEEALKSAIIEAQRKHLEIDDVYTPFPVHGLDALLGLEESRLHMAGFVYGLIGFLVAFLGMSWINTIDWPIIFGGKPFWSVPAYVPIMFECTVLFSAVGMTVTFYVVSGMGPGVKNPILHPRITDDKFCIAFDADDVGESDAMAFFKATGADETGIKIIDKDE